MPRALHLAFAYYFLKEPERSKDCAAHFDVVFNLFINLPAPVNGPDMLEILMPLHIQAMQKTSLPTEQILSAVNAWANQRPASILPLRERAMVFLNAGQSSSAMNVATELVRKQPRDEESMQILAAAAKSTYADSGQDGKASWPTACRATCCGRRCHTRSACYSVARPRWHKTSYRSHASAVALRRMSSRWHVGRGTCAQRHSCKVQAMPRLPISWTVGSRRSQQTAKQSACGLHAARRKDCLSNDTCKMLSELA